MKSIWKHPQRGADYVKRNEYIHPVGADGRTYLRGTRVPIVVYPHVEVASRSLSQGLVALSWWVCRAVVLTRHRHVVDYVLARGEVVAGKSVSRGDPRRVARVYDFKFRMLLGSLIMRCRSGQRCKG